MAGLETNTLEQLLKSDNYHGIRSASYVPENDHWVNTMIIFNENGRGIGTLQVINDTQEITLKDNNNVILATARNGLASPRDEMIVQFYPLPICQDRVEGRISSHQMVYQWRCEQTVIEVQQCVGNRPVYKLFHGGRQLGSVLQSHSAVLMDFSKPCAETYERAMILMYAVKQYYCVYKIHFLPSPNILSPTPSNAETNPYYVGTLGDCLIRYAGYTTSQQIKSWYFEILDVPTYQLRMVVGCPISTSALAYLFKDPFGQLQFSVAIKTGVAEVRDSKGSLIGRLKTIERGAAASIHLGENIEAGLVANSFYTPVADPVPCSYNFSEVEDKSHTTVAEAYEEHKLVNLSFKKKFSAEYNALILSYVTTLCTWNYQTMEQRAHNFSSYPFVKGEAEEACA